MPVVKQMVRRRNFLNKKNKLRSFKRIKCNVTNIISNTSKWCLLHYKVCRLLRLSPYDVCWYMMVVILWRLSVTTFVASWCLSPIRTFVTYRVCHSIDKRYFYVQGSKAVSGWWTIVNMIALQKQKPFVLNECMICVQYILYVSTVLYCRYPWSTILSFGTMDKDWQNLLYCIVLQVPLVNHSFLWNYGQGLAKSHRGKYFLTTLFKIQNKKEKGGLTSFMMHHPNFWHCIILTDDTVSSQLLTLYHPNCWHCIIPTDDTGSSQLLTLNHPNCWHCIPTSDTVSS